MEQVTRTPCGKKRNSLSREDEGPALPRNKRMQSTLVITGPDGKILTKNGHRDSTLDSWSTRSKFDSVRVRKQLLVSETAGAGDMTLNSGTKKAVANSALRQPGFSTPQPLAKTGHFSTHHNHMITPIRLPSTPMGFCDYASSTPATQSSKVRPPMSSSRKLKSKAVAKLRMLDDQELQASRLVQVRRGLLMERQERAYVAWLNHVLDKPATAGSRKSNFQDFVSRNSSVTPPNSDSVAGTGLRLIDEVFWDEDCVKSSPRDPTHLGRSPLLPLNGVGNRVTSANSFKRSLKDVFATPDKKTFVGQSPATTPHLSSKRLKMITEHGFAYPRDTHMRDVGRLSDLARRLKLHFNQSEREEILATITQLAKHIDEGRLRMKRGCGVLADVALRKKALHVLLNYNAYWMRIGLHVVLGHTTLLKERLNEEEDSKQTGDKGAAGDAEFALFEVFLDRHFLAHPGLAKKFASNKAIDGLYREGYSEALGRVILKRFFLLVLVLDKAKCQTTLKITDGIDGVDGGSPPLFRSDARVKSSRQALQEFLSDLMHGEGDVIGNLNALGYQVHHCQAPLADYDFAVVDLIEDLQDGVRLCRLVQLLAANDTFFLEHIQVPSNGRKRQLHNCQIALESLAQAGVPLEDEDGYNIDAADIVGGNRDKLFPLLWNIMVHLQIPLLVSRPRLCQEIAKLQGIEGGVALGLNIGTVELLLKWTQVTCMISGNLNVRNFRTSFADGQALCCIVNFYLPILLPQNALLRPTSISNFEEQKGVQNTDTPDDKDGFSPAYKRVVAHNFGLVQDVARKLGSIPEVLQLVDLLGDPGMSERNVIIFVAFLCSRLLRDKPLQGGIARGADANQQLDELLRYSSQCNLESESPSGFNRSYMVPWPQHEALCGTLQPQVYGQTQMNEKAQSILSKHALGKICQIQVWWRRALVARKHSLSRQRAAQKIQRAWRMFLARIRNNAALKMQAHWRGFLVRRMLQGRSAAAILIQRWYRHHVTLRNRERAAHVLQFYFRAWVKRRNYFAAVRDMCKIQAFWWAHEARGQFLRERRAVRKIETEWLNYVIRNRFHISQVQWQQSQSAQIIQAHWRGYSTRKSLIKQSRADVYRQSQRLAAVQKMQNRRVRVHQIRMQQLEEVQQQEAAKKIQLGWRVFIALRKRQQHSIAITTSCIRIQAHWRGYVARQRFEAQKQAAKKIQRVWRTFTTVLREMQFLLAVRSCTRIQACWRGHAARRRLEVHRRAAEKIQVRRLQFRNRRRQSSASKIQAYWRSHTARQKFEKQKQAAKKIQKGWQRFIALRNRKLSSIVVVQACWRARAARRRFGVQKKAAQQIQMEWRRFTACRRQKQLLHLSAIAIQARWRTHLARRRFTLLIQSVLVIQRYCRGLLQRTRYRTQKRAVIVIQASYRARLVQKERRIHQAAAAACRIQTWWRAGACRRQFLLQKSALSILQQRWRTFLEHRKRDSSAKKIQAVWRAYRDLRLLARENWAASLIQRHYYAHLKRRRERRHRNAAAVVIQAQYRAFNERKKYRSNQLRSICKVQSLWRARQVRQQFIKQRQSVQRIQSAWRRRRLRHFSAAILLQSCFRGHMQRLQYGRIKDAVCMVQANVKGWIQRKAFRAVVGKICRLQAVWRARCVRAQYLRTKVAALQIQAIWRGYLDRKEILRWTAATVLIQRQYRSYIHTKRAVVLCQAAWKGRVARQRLRVCKEGVTRIQAAVRGMLQRRRLREQKMEQKRAASIIQTVFSDGPAANVVSLIQEEQKTSLLRLSCAEIIQAAWRKHLQLKNAHAANRSCEAAKLEIHRASCSNQGRPDDYSLRLCKKATEEARANTMAHSFICPQGRNRTLDPELQQQSNEEMQRAVYAATAVSCQMMTLNLHTEAALKMQRCWRSHWTKKSGIRHVEEITSASNSAENLTTSAEQRLGSCQQYDLQELKAGHVMLSWLRTLVQHSRYVKLRRCSVVIQRYFRGWIHRSSFAHKRKSAIVVQARWRGFATRGRQSQAQHPSGELRQRMHSTAATVQDSQRLCNRLTEALSLLVTQKTVSGILSTCRTIDVATQHSKNCCERLAEAGAILKLLQLIQTINRSPPLEQVLKHSLSTLNNLARYLPLATLIADAPGAIRIISEQLHIFRNNEEIFAQAISVLQVVCKTPAGVEVLRRERPVFRRLQLIAQSLERKVRVEKRNLEKLPWATSPTVQRKSVQKKMSEAHCQFLSTMALLKEINRLSHYQTAAATASTPVEQQQQTSRSVVPTRTTLSGSGSKRHSNPGSHQQRPPLANLSRRRATDVPFQDRSNLF